MPNLTDMRIRGRVRNSSGDPVPEAKVRIRGFSSQDKGRELSVNSEGEYDTVSYDCKRKVYLNVLAPGYAISETKWTDTTPLDQVERVITVDFILHPEILIALRVLNAGMSPVNGAQVYRSISGDRDYYYPNCTTGLDGFA